MNDLCKRCEGSCCILKLYPLDQLKESGAKAVHYDGETSQTIADGYIQMDKTCQYLKDGKCEIYESRPQTCRDFKVGSEKCLLVMKAKMPELYEEYMNELEK